jgi:hypothetical protein
MAPALREAEVGRAPCQSLSWVGVSMSQTGAQPAAIALLVSTSIVIFASVGCEGSSRDEVMVSEVTASETTAFDELTFPEVLSEYARNVPNYGYDPSGPSPFASFASPHPFGPELMQALSESEALIDSLSPGVRASYDGALLAQEDARKREQDREEAEYAAFIEGRLRRLNAVRPSKK